jgi:hypothetical protein
LVGGSQCDVQNWVSSRALAEKSFELFKANDYAGIDAEKLPTIVVAYLESNWSTADVKFIYFNEKTEDVEICAAIADEVELNKGDAIKTFDREIQKKERELADLHEKKAYFQKQFARYFKVAMEPAEIGN